MSTNVLLHSCCGPCASSCVERLLAEGWTPTLFYANDNLDSPAEWERRLDALRTISERMNVPYAISPYSPAPWKLAVAEFVHDPEGGQRCAVCFRHNFKRTAEYALAHGFTHWTTTLSVSSHKNNAMLFEAGNDISKECAGLTFEPMNFKSNNGFQRSTELAKQYGLYRQNYCGCEYSKK